MTDARGPFADFFGRLWRQKPLGIASGSSSYLILILLAIFADVLAPYPFDQIIVVLGIAGGVGGSRVVRGAVVATKGNDFFLAARAVGAPTRQVLVRHVLPNIVAPLIIVFSINVGGVILAEASLSFLGFGLPIKVPSWGGMLSREGRRFMEQAPWLALWPGLCLTIVVYSFNMLGDAMRDLLDPRLRGGGRLGAGDATVPPTGPTSVKPKARVVPKSIRCIDCV